MEREEYDEQVITQTPASKIGSGDRKLTNDRLEYLH